MFQQKTRHMTGFLFAQYHSIIACGEVILNGVVWFSSAAGEKV